MTNLVSGTEETQQHYVLGSNLHCCNWLTLVVLCRRQLSTQHRSRKQQPSQMVGFKASFTPVFLIMWDDTENIDFPTSPVPTL